MSRVYRLFVACCTAFLAGIVLKAILQNGVDVPFWDEWDLVRTVRQVSAGEISWGRALLLRIGEHRVGMQLLGSLGAWQITGMNMRSAMVLNWGLAAAFCILAAMVTRGGVMAWTVLGAATLWVFNPAAYQVWLWGLPLVHVLVPFFFLCGVALAQSRLPEGARLLSASVCAMLASFTLASGFLLWPLFVPVMACYTLPGLLRRQRAAAVGSAALLLCSLAAYGIPQRTPTPGEAGPTTMLSFFLVYTGNLMALAADPLPIRWVQVAGAALTLLFPALAFLTIRHLRGRPQWPAAVIWSCIGTYSLMAGAMVAWSRAGFGVAYALESSRYVLASSFLPVSIVVLGALLTARLAQDLPRRLHLYSWVLCATMATVLAGCGLRLFQTDRSLATMRRYHDFQVAGKVALAAVNVIDLPQFRHIYSSDNRQDFKLSANYLNRAGRLRPPLWNDTFLRRLAAPALAEEPAAGAVEQFSFSGGSLRLAGSGHLPEGDSRPDGVLVLAIPPQGSPRMLAVLFPLPAHGWVWSADIPLGLPLEPETRIRCFVYNAQTGRAHRLRGEPRIQREMVGAAESIGGNPKEISHR